MSKFLVTEDNPDGHRLVDILCAIHNEILERAIKLKDDRRTEATSVLNNNLKILNFLAECISLAEDSSCILEKSFGPSVVDKPRIGVL